MKVAGAVVIPMSVAVLSVRISTRSAGEKCCIYSMLLLLALASGFLSISLRCGRAAVAPSLMTKFRKLSVALSAFLFFSLARRWTAVYGAELCQSATD